MIKISMNESREIKEIMTGLEYELNKVNSCPEYIREKLGMINTRITRIENAGHHKCECFSSNAMTYKERAIDRAFAYIAILPTEEGDYIEVTVSNREESYTRKFTFCIDYNNSLLHVQNKGK